MWVVGDPNSVSHASTASSLPTGSSPQPLILSSSRNWIVTGQAKIVLNDLLEAKGTVWKLLTSIRAFLLGSCGSLYQGWEARVGCSTQLVSLPPFRVPGCRSTRAYAPIFSLHQNLLLLDMVCWDFMMYGCMWHSTSSLCADAIILYPPHHIQSCFLSGGLIYYSVRPVGRYKCFSWST